MQSRPKVFRLCPEDNALVSFSGESTCLDRALKQAVRLFKRRPGSARLVTGNGREGGTAFGRHTLKRHVASASCDARGNLLRRWS